MTKDVSIRILKSGSCPSLSGKSKLTYEIACSDDGDLALRVATNTGGGFFSDEWLPLSAIEKAAHGSAKKGLTSTTLRPLFKGKSVNTAGFLLAVLKHEGAVGLQEGKTRLYEVGDFEGFLAASRALMQTASNPRGKAPTPAKKAIQRPASKRG